MQISLEHGSSGQNNELSLRLLALPDGYVACNTSETSLG